MTKIKRLLTILPLFFLAIACRPSIGTPNEQLVSPTQQATFTPMEITPAAPQPTTTPPTEPTETPVPTFTPLPYTSSPEPFLSEDLSLIQPENIVDLQQVAVLPIREIYALKFSQSGDKLATLSERWQDRSRFMEVWDLVSGEQILILDNLENPWRTFFSTDESQLYVFYPNRGIDVYDLIDQKFVRRMETNADRVDFSADGEYLATGQYLGTAEESTISIMDLASEREQLVIKVPGLVMEIKFSPDGNLLVGGFQRGNHYFDYVWETSTGEVVAELMDYQYGLTFSPDSSVAIAAKGERVSVFSTANWALLNTIGFADPYRDVAPKSFSPDGKILAAEDRYDILFIKPDTGEVLYILPDECDVRFPPEGTTVVTWCYQGDLKIWGIIKE